MTAYTISIDTNCKCMFDAINSTCEHAFASDNNNIVCFDLQEIQDTIDIVDTQATFKIIKKESV